MRTADSCLSPYFIFANIEIVCFFIAGIFEFYYFSTQEYLKIKSSKVCTTVLLRNNLTENAFGTRPKRVLKCVPFAFHLRSICVPFAFHLRSKCVPFAFHFYWNAPAFRVPVTLVSKPDSVGNHRYFPSINQRNFHILCLHVCKERTSKFLLGRVPAAFRPRSDRVPTAFRPRSDRVPTAFGTHLERERSVRLFLSSTVHQLLFISLEERVQSHYLRTILLYCNGILFCWF